ncbi:MAG: Rho termination factor N-terminal domain-containing protein, partial [Mucilaginibacter sp.]
MSDTIELNDKLVSELREIAKSLGISEADELRKPLLISRITEQQELIEAARAQQNAIEQNYSEKNAPEAAESGERTRKRIRTIKSPAPARRTEVPLDDTRLFDVEDDETPATEEAEEVAQPAAPVAEQQDSQEGQADAAEAEAPAGENRAQKFERRVNQSQQKNQEALNLDF